MDVKDVDIAELKPYERNAKAHPEKQVEQIAKSIEKFGWAQPLAIDEDGVIIIGHGRYEAAKKLKLKTVPCVQISDLTDEEIRMLRLADNKLNESEWLDDILAEELQDLDFGDFDLDFGINLDEEPDEAVEDDFDEEPPEEPKSKRGDIYQLGRHRLMCGDSTKAEDVERLMGGQSADLLLTDPPYGIDYGSNLQGRGDGHGGADEYGWKSYDAPTWDRSRIPKEAFELMREYSREQIIWGGNYYTDYLPPKMCWLIWDKGQRAFSLADGEMAWTSYDKAMRIITYSRGAALNDGKIHPTQKPIEVMRWCIQDIAERNEKIETVLDLYGGSGSTMITCEQTGHICHMMELEPKYIDLIIDRWEKFTGEKAVKIDGETTERN